MTWLTKTFTSYPGRKLLAALTGIGLVLFLVMHLLGNLQIFVDSPQFNEYAHALHDGPLIVIGDIGLLIMVPLHILAVLSLARGNRAARGEQRYKVHQTKQERSKLAILASKTTVFSGAIILLFLIAHIWHFRLQHEAIATGEFAGVAAGDLKGAIILTLKQPIWAILYILGSLATGWHLAHGIQAAFRSLGLYNRNYTPLIVKLGTVLAIILAVGFVSIPAWIMLTQ